MPDEKKHISVVISETALKNFEKILQETEEKFGNKTSLKLILRFEKFVSIIGIHPYLFGFYLRSKNIRNFILPKRSSGFIQAKKERSRNNSDSLPETKTNFPVKK